MGVVKNSPTAHRCKTITAQYVAPFRSVAQEKPEPTNALVGVISPRKEALYGAHSARMRWSIYV